jgi:site-specific DNA-methyltransferase (adenine-specific)
MVALVSRIETIGDATLYLGDCMEILPTLPKVDAVITDPPYGTGTSKKSGLRKGATAKSDYEGFFDSLDNVIENVIPAVSYCIERFERVALTCGFKAMWHYPKPSHVGSFQYGAGTTVMSCWGPALWQPILFYGRDPKQGTLTPDSFQGCNDSDITTDHPCPKPLKSWTLLVARASLSGEVVLDPFMGSGTTGVAAVKLGRSFIGVEREPKYFDIACRRIEQAYKQRPLFEAEPPRKPEQLGLEAA